MRHVVYDVTNGLTWACWAIIGIVWVFSAALARQRGRAAEQEHGGDTASLAGVGFGLGAVLTSGSLWAGVSTGSPGLRAVGVVLLIPATGVTVWARVSLGRFWSSAAIARTGHQLRTDGPYALTRHPIYTGILAMLAATALTQGLGRWVALLAAITLVLIAKLRAEERLLERQFPGQYRRYRKQVPALVPRLLRRGH